MSNLDESWLRYPEAKIRMREGGIKTILEGFGGEGFCSSSVPRINYVEDGIYIELLLNVGKHGSVVALPLEIFIPAKLPVPKKTAKEKKGNESPSITPVVVSATAVDELHDDNAEPTTGSTS